MEATKPRLGRGLDALLSTNSNGNMHHEGKSAAGRVSVGEIQQNPYQPRKRFDDEEMQHLAASIREHGILQPLVVRQIGEQFQLIAGERRLRAAQAAGLGDVPVHIVEFNDQQVYEAALVENIQRSDLNPIEKAQGFKDYIERFGMSQEQLGAKLGMDRTTISNLVGLLNLPADVQDAVRLGQISLGHAKILKGLSSAEQQLAFCHETILRGYSVHALEQAVKASRSEDAEPTSSPRTVVEKTSHVSSVENELRQRLACRVEIKVKAKDKGQIVIAFDSNDDFERLIDTLRK